MVRGVRKRFGQHFLERAWVDKVIRAIDPKADELFIEIGPCRGALTRPLVERAKAVMAFEIDRDLAAELSATAPPNLTVTQGDFLEQADFRLPTSDSVRVAGNLPYNVASPILFKLVELYALGVPLVDATVMLQREVADRLIAPPGQDSAAFAGLVQAVFTRRRKTLANALLAYEGTAAASSPAEMLAAADLDRSRRPETLSIAEFARLADAYSGKRRAVL